MLTDKQVQKLTKPGRYSAGRDSFGLAINVHKAGDGSITRSWVQRYSVEGRQRSVGLGPWPIVSAEEAQGLAFDNKRSARHGTDPLPAPASKPKAAKPKTKSTGPTFAETHAAYCEIHSGEWSAAVERDWHKSFETYAYPAIGSIPVASLTARDIIEVLSAEMPWSVHKNLRSRVRKVLAHAVNEGHALANVAVGIEASLPKRESEAENLEAPAPAEAHEAFCAVSDLDGMAALWATFTVLTACRPTEARLAEWPEIDFDAKTWTIPAERTKTKREHRVALSAEAVRVLNAAKRAGGKSVLVFPKPNGKAYSHALSSELRKRAGVSWSLHGFARATFTTWAAEAGFEAELVERACAHVEANKVRAAYNRSDRLADRFALMEAWSAHLLGG